MKVVVDNLTYDVPDDATTEEINAITAPDSNHIDLSSIHPDLHQESLQRAGVISPQEETPGVNLPETVASPEPVAQTYNPAPEHRAKLESLLRGGYNAATLGLGDEIQAIGATPVDLAASALYGEKPSITESYNRALETSRAAEEQSKEQNPGNYLIGQVLGTVGTGVAGAGTKTGKALADSLRSGEILGQELGTAGKVIKGIGAGATSAGAYGFGEGQGSTEDRLKQAGDYAITGGLIGGAAPAAIPTAKAVVKAVTPTIDEGIKDVAKLAQKYDIPLSIDQITKSRSVKTK